MTTYKVKYGQNIFDVAMVLYGSVEGVYGLMMANPGLCMSTELEEGDELFYQEDWQINPSVVRYFADSDICPANGECKVYTINEHTDIPFIMVILSEGCPRFYMDVQGTGTLKVDWGDGKQEETLQLSSSKQIPVSHWYSEVSTQKVIRFYGTPSISKLLIKTGQGELRLLKPMTLQTYQNKSGIKDIAAKSLITIA